jgi:hypothetical protein
MKLGTVKVIALTLDKRGNISKKTSWQGGVEVANCREVVINGTVFIKASDNHWTQKGKKRSLPISHEALMYRIKAMDHNRKRFNIWVSGHTVNVVDKKLKESVRKSHN